MDERLPDLARLAARVAGTSPDRAVDLARMLVGPDDCGPWRSTLNNDGSPLQVCVTLAGRGTPTVRLIGDPAAEPGATAGQRSDRELGARSAVLASHAAGLAAVSASVVDHLLPTDPAARAALPGGGTWLAADLAGRGAALYATAKWGDRRHRWDRARHWMETVLPENVDTAAALGRLAAGTVLVSVGVEGATTADARVKLYWRLDGTAGLRDLGLPLLDDPAFADVLAGAIGDRRVSRAAVVGSVGLRLATGAVADAKLDVCGHCVRRSPADWAAVVADLAARHGLCPLPAGTIESAELAFLGFGLAADGSPRLNVYLKARHGSE